MVLRRSREKQLDFRLLVLFLVWLSLGCSGSRVGEPCTQVLCPPGTLCAANTPACEGDQALACCDGQLVLSNVCEHCLDVPDHPGDTVCILRYPPPAVCP